MNFYQAHQFDMLQRVAKLLKANRDKLCTKVPIFDDVITDYIEFQEKLNTLKKGNVNVVRISTLKKGTVRQALMDAVMKLQGVILAQQNKRIGQATKEKKQNATDGSSPDNQT